MVVCFHEVSHALPDLFDVFEYPSVDGLCLECSEESFGHPVGLGLRDKGITWGDPLTALFMKNMIL